MKHQLLALALEAGCLLHAVAIEPGKSQSLTSPDQVPQGLSASDWSSIRSAYAAGRATKAAGFTSQQAYVKASNPGAGNGFGLTVAVSGDTVVVGASAEDSSTKGVNSVPNQATSNSGAAYVFIRSSGTWSQQAYLKASNTEASDIFGQSVAISGDTIVVGASEEDSNAVGVNSTGQANNSASNSGAAYVFFRSGSTWSQQAYLKASNAEAIDIFGFSVAVSGDTVVVGALNEASNAVGVNANIPAQANNSSTKSGAAYVFTRSGSTWSQQAYLKASNTEAFDEFGRSVAVSGDTVVVGANGEASSGAGVNGIGQGENNADISGAAYVFTRSTGTWSQQAYLKASNTGANDNFGWSVAISQDVIVVGAYLESSNALGVDGNQADNSSGGSGAAFVFGRSGSIWSQQAYLKASNTEASDFFGYSVAVSGGTIISGANQEDSVNSGINSVPNDTGTADESGAAYIFTLPVADAPRATPPAVVKFLIQVKVSKAKFGKVTGSGSFSQGSSVTLKAKAKKGRTFVGWYEKKKLITKKKVLVIQSLTADRSLVAKFK